MDQFEPIIRHLERFIPIDEEEISYFTSLLKVNRVKKKQYIVQPGFPCKHRFYVVEGAFRSFLYDGQANEHTVAFAVEDWWITDFNSYIYQRPATLFVEALEDSLIFQIDYNAEQLLLETHPRFEKFLRILSQRALAAVQRRMLSNLSKSAEERYEEFVENYPQIANRVPQYALASFLGFSTEYMSKIRNRRTKKLN